MCAWRRMCTPFSALRGTHRRDTWLVWREGKAPDFVMEIASPGTWRRDVGEKRDIYARMRVQEYVRLDPTGQCFTPALVIEWLDGGIYRPRPVTMDADGILRGYSAVLELEICVLPGLELRFYDPATGDGCAATRNRRRRCGRRKPNCNNRKRPSRRRKRPGSDSKRPSSDRKRPGRRRKPNCGNRKRPGRRPRRKRPGCGRYWKAGGSRNRMNNSPVACRQSTRYSGVSRDEWRKMRLATLPGLTLRSE